MNECALRFFRALGEVKRAINGVDLRCKKIELANALLALIGHDEEQGTLLPEAPRKMARPPVEEVQIFCAKAGISNIDALWFWHKMDGNGWTVDGKAVKRWQSTLIAWKVAGYLPSQKANVTLNNGHTTTARVSQSYISKELAVMNRQVKAQP